MAKLIQTIDSNDFIVDSGIQSCGDCPVRGLENYADRCEEYFKFLFGDYCGELYVIRKPDFKLNVEKIQ